MGQQNWKPILNDRQPGWQGFWEMEEPGKEEGIIHKQIGVCVERVSYGFQDVTPGYFIFEMSTLGSFQEMGQF